MQLFVDRARVARPGWTPSRDEAAHVATIVRRLDGLPLAIELAAARTGVLGTEAIAKRLDHRFELLVSNARGAVGRQRTLRAALDWSWTLLNEPERAALAQCSSFRGRFALEDAEGVVDLGAVAGAQAPIDALQALRDKSLLQAVEMPEASGEICFYLLSVREFAREMLERSGGAPGTAARYVRHFAHAGTQVVAPGYGTAEAARRISFMRSNLEAAHTCALEIGDVESAAALALSLYRVALDQGPQSWFLWMCDATLRAAEHESMDPTLRARLLVARGTIRFIAMDPEGATMDVRDAVKLSPEPLVEMRALQILSQLAYQRGEAAAISETTERITAIARSATDKGLEGFAHMLLGVLFVSEGRRRDEAREHLDRAVECLTATGDAHRLGTTLQAAGVLAIEESRLTEARTQLRRAAEVAREVGNRRGEGLCLLYLAHVAAELGELPEARAQCERSMQMLSLIGDRWQRALALGLLGAIDALGGEVGGARARLDRAETELLEAGDRIFIDAVRVHRGQVDLALARASRATGDEAASAEHRARAEARSEGLRDHRCDDVRFAVRLLRAALDRA